MIEMFVLYFCGFIFLFLLWIVEEGEQIAEIDNRKSEYLFMQPFPLCAVILSELQKAIGKFSVSIDGNTWLHQIHSFRR